MSDSKKIYPAMLNILKEVEAIEKSRNADMGGAGRYNFRGIDDMYNALHDLFAKHGVFIIPEVLETKLEVQEKERVYNNQVSKSLQYSTVVTMRFTFVAEDGSSLTATGVGHAIDSSDKGTNKAQSSALKYCLMQTFLIPTQDDKDVENSNNEVKPATKPVTGTTISNSNINLAYCFEVFLRQGSDEMARLKASDKWKLRALTKEQAEQCGFQWGEYEQSKGKKWAWELLDHSLITTAISTARFKRSNLPLDLADKITVEGTDIEIDSSVFELEPM